jgi:outer membrane receptor for ferrienterochelin and colicin
MKKTKILKSILILLTLIVSTNFYGQFTKVDSVKYVIDSIQVDSLSYCFSASEIRNIGEATFKYQESLRRNKELQEQRKACIMQLRKEEEEKAKLAAENIILNLELVNEKRVSKMLKIGCVGFGIISVGTITYLIVSN